MGERIASEEARVWMHRMGVVLLTEEVNWKLLVLRVTALQPLPPYR